MKDEQLTIDDLAGIFNLHQSIIISKADDVHDAFPKGFRLGVRRNSPRRWMRSETERYKKSVSAMLNTPARPIIERLRKGKSDGGNHELYRHLDANGDLLYIGISVSAFGRFRDHKHNSHWAQQITCITIERFPSRSALVKAEAILIGLECPQQNVVHSMLREVV